MTKKLFFYTTLFFFMAVMPFKFANALTFSPPRFELSGNPGQTLEKEMTLTNEGTDPQTFYSVFRNFEAEGETGIPSPTDSTTGLASWMKTEEKITIAPKSSTQVAFQVYIPKEAEPGGYFAMILWSTTSPDVAPGQVAIGAQTGPLVLLSVNGDVKVAGGIKEFNLKDNQTFYTALPVDFYYKFKNDGGDRVKPVGNIEIKNILGLTRTEIVANRVEGNVLPGGTRRFETEWKGGGDNANTDATKPTAGSLGFWGNVKNEWNNFAFGYYTATLELTYGASDDHAESFVKFTVFPWHLLLVIIIAIILFYFITKKLLHNYNRFIIHQATMAMEQMEEQKSSHEIPRQSVRTEARQEEREHETLNLRVKRSPRKKV